MLVGSYPKGRNDQSRATSLEKQLVGCILVAFMKKHFKNESKRARHFGLENVLVPLQHGGVGDLQSQWQDGTSNHRTMRRHLQKSYARRSVMDGNLR